MALRARLDYPPGSANMQLTPAPNQPRDPRIVPAIALALAFITLVLYWRVKGFQFNNYDDGPYITENPFIRDGITGKSVNWAFTTGYFATWHPLTWLSHMLDVNLYGFDAGGHHFTSVLFHVANTLLLFLALWRWTGAVWRAGFVAALFAWHPMHVESVAWVAERKDVLSGLFFMFTLLAYGEYARLRDGSAGAETGSRRWGWYALAIVFFALGLMAKPMLVSVPLILLMLDYWPFARIRTPVSARSVTPLLVEKIPFLLLAAGSSVVTFLTQRESGAVMGMKRYPFTDRCANALLAYARYLGKLVWPAKLAVPYPYVHGLPIIEVAGAALLLLGLTALALFLGRSRPPVLVGWLWFVIMMLPVIGLVQVGEQALADRYTYLPYIGLFAIAAWEFPRAFNAAGGGRLIYPASAVVLVACLLTASRQIGYWRNSLTLWTHTLEVTKDNQTAECDLGATLNAAQQYAEAARHERAALRIKPADAVARNNLGGALAGLAEYEEAARQFMAGIKSNAAYAGNYYNLGLVWMQTGRMDEAEAVLRYFTRLNPYYPAGFARLGYVLADRGDLDGAIDQFQKALALWPDFSYATRGLSSALEKKSEATNNAAPPKPDPGREHENLGVVYALQGRFDRAESEFAQALKSSPDSASVHSLRGNALLLENKTADAAEEYRQALRLRAGQVQATLNLAVALAKLGQEAEAIDGFREVLRLQPENVPATRQLAWLYATAADTHLRNVTEALELSGKATQKSPDDPAAWDARAAALAQAGRFTEAAAAATKAQGLALYDESLAADIGKRLETYKKMASP